MNVLWYLYDHIELIIAVLTLGLCGLNFAFLLDIKADVEEIKERIKKYGIRTHRK